MCHKAIIQLQKVAEGKRSAINKYPAVIWSVCWQRNWLQLMGLLRCLESGLCESMHTSFCSSGNPSQDGSEVQQFAPEWLGSKDVDGQSKQLQKPKQKQKLKQKPSHSGQDRPSRAKWSRLKTSRDAFARLIN